MMGKPLDLAKQAYAAFATGNIPVLLDMMADDVEWKFLAKTEFGTRYGGTYRGKQEVAGFFGKLAQTTEIVGFEPREFFEGPNHVTTIGMSKGRALPDGDIHETDWIQFSVLTHQSVI